MKLKIDLHVHTSCSYDSLIDPEDLIFYAKRQGLNGVAVTDHDTMEGLSKVSQTKDFLIIPGLEISSLKGHIVGLNINKMVPPKLGVQETVDRIHEAGGIAVACHPFSLFRDRLKEEINGQFDAIEIINSSAFPFHYSVRYSRRIASRLGIPGVAGSDAHYGPEIGTGYTVLDAECKVESVINAIKKGNCSPQGTAIPLSTRLKRELLVLKKRKGW
ncbi:MAG: CehA/McbA family metallohydrolase [Thermoproteota archaeon]